MDTGFSHGINVAFWAYSCPEQHSPLKTPPCACWLDHINSQLETSSGFFPSSSKIPSMEVLNSTSGCYRHTNHGDSHQGVWANCRKTQIIHADWDGLCMPTQTPHSHLVPFTWLCHFIHHPPSDMHLFMSYMCIAPSVLLFCTQPLSIHPHLLIVRTIILQKSYALVFVFLLCQKKN